MVKLLVSVVFIVVFLKVGFMILGALARPVPAPPPSGEMRRISQRYRCVNCGAELKMTAAPDEDPPAPRHCMEDMERLAARDL